MCSLITDFHLIEKICLSSSYLSISAIFVLHEFNAFFDLIEAFLMNIGSIIMEAFKHGMIVS